MATNSRLYKTNLGGWHELVALSQGYINQCRCPPLKISMEILNFVAFTNMYKLSDPDSPLKVFNKKIGGVGKMTGCKLLAPELVLMVEDNDFNYLEYHLKFQQGDLMLYADEDGDEEKHFDVSGWIFVFKIMIGAKEIPHNSAEYKEISERVPLTVDFSLSKLWLDSTTADTGNKKLREQSYFGGLDWSKEPYDVRENFDTFIIKWVSAAAEKGQTLLGVTVTPKTLGMPLGFSS